MTELRHCASARMAHVLEQLAALQERSAQLAQAQRGRDRAIAGVQVMKAQLVRARADKREREIAFLQAQALPLADHLAELRGERGRTDTPQEPAGASTLSAEDDGLRAVMHEAMQRGRDAQASGLAASRRLCAGSSVQCSGCGSKLRVVVDASYRGVRLERYAVILQRQEPTRKRQKCEAVPATAAGAAHELPLDSCNGEANSAGSASSAMSRIKPGAQVGSEGHDVNSTGFRILQDGWDWVVAQHSLPRFVPVSRLAARLLPSDLRAFVDRVKDYVQALAARREQWQELLRLYAVPNMTSMPAHFGREGELEAVAMRRSRGTEMEIGDPRASDAFDQLSFTVANFDTGAEGHSAGMEAARWRCWRVQLVFDDLRKSAASRASVQIVARGGAGMDGDEEYTYALPRARARQVLAVLVASSGPCLVDRVLSLVKILRQE